MTGQPLTTVRIAHAIPRTVQGLGVDTLVVLVDDAGSRALPIWLRAREGHSLRLLLNRPIGAADAGTDAPAGVAIELTDQMLRAAGATVVTVDIDEPGPRTGTALIELHGPTGPQRVTARLGESLALAAVHGAAIRVADAVLDRWAEPVAGDDLLTSFLDRVPFPGFSSGAYARRGPERAPRNLDFAAGLDGWDLTGTFLIHPTRSHWRDYTAAVSEDGYATLAATTDEPHGFAVLGQAVLADDYRGDTVVFSGDLRGAELQHQSAVPHEDTEDTAESGGGVGGSLVLWPIVLPSRGPGGDVRRPANKPVVTPLPVCDSTDWTHSEAILSVPENAIFIMFGITLTGRGRIELRAAEFAVRGREVPAHEST
jgi:bifunctional DNase/RNase